MDYINELIYANHIAQTKKLAKDKKQKNQYRRIALLNDYQHEDEVAEDNQETVDATETVKVISVEEDRRKGGDRRKKQQDRGRYIESRQQKNRRHQRELSLKV